MHEYRKRRTNICIKMLCYDGLLTHSWIHQGVKAFKFEHVALALDLIGWCFFLDTLYIRLVI